MLNDDAVSAGLKLLFSEVIRVEFLIYTMAAVAGGIVLFKPKFEKLAFWLLGGASAIGAVMYLIAANNSWLPAVNL